MTGKDIIKGIMERRDVTNAQLAKKLGITQATMWARLNNQSAKDLQLGVFDEMLRALGYEIVIRRRVGEEEGDEFIAEFDGAEKEERRGRPRKEQTMEQNLPL